MSSAVTSPVEPQPKQVSWHKLLRFAPLIMIMLYMRSQQKPVTQIAIAEAFDINRKTAAAYLRQLTKFGMIAHVDHNNGYILVEGGQQMLLELDAGWVENGHPTLKESFKELKDSKTKEKNERKNQMSTFWTSPTELTTERVLSETGQLFGFETIAFGVSDRDPSMAMALVAHAYDQRHKLAKPQVFVYRRLQRNEPPDKKYLINPLAYLPNVYLHALGLAELEVLDAEVVDEKDNAATFEKVDTDSDEYKAWQEILKALQMDIPRASFDTWLRDTYVSTFDGKTMKVCVRNAYARDWLISRMTNDVNKLLREFFKGDAVTVQFVTEMEA